ncbi:MAG: hypothetical protein A2087_14800 [Spirochaetes bacterium GWD1_61_31]|nr:MAG: hypothetical protein A2Y37_12855 [Spirochaetes bacterium GWB1_60_80]OHD28673.1 MAG: hypothetical protein A2004_05805 [Spirochaetes bacterium GWC1_61_12]OHD38906.1 MAG: hypothetical protein A2087_14800 [Spirochaetes bacterium GWD1_61_31]OHD43315.1 MAG: hypothetical protein A2Y35_08550 [Spirochaetes bacterium GWE1_60_18]OHD58853.1 MAG: hypothetical protein A2Y32_08920 [Spirochaetes bacterium GWF1_60_12]HAP42507.1 hypothetical protein [Spirochaetaceae bacterium]
MKRNLLIVVSLVLLPLGLLFAAGDKAVVPGQAPGDAPVALESVTLTGTLHQDIGKPLVLRVDGVEYAIMLPLRNMADLTLSQGQTVSVEGFLLPTPTDAPAGAYRLLHVTKATIDGTVYVFAGGPGMMGGRGGRGSRGGMMQPGQGMPAQGGMGGWRPQPGTGTCPYCGSGE